MRKDLKIGLALAGGGARGGAHLGVLHVFHENDIPIHVIAGSSAGAVMGAMYAATLDPVWMEKRFHDYIQSEAFRAVGTHRLRKGSVESDSFFNQLGRFMKDKLVIHIALGRHGIIDAEKMVASMEYLLPVRDFSELKIPLLVVVTDLNSGSELVITSGDLLEAVLQSCSIPGFISPSEKDGQVLVDGGVSSPLPINALLNSGSDFTIAVDIARRKMEALGDFNLMDVVARSELVTRVKLSDELVTKADFVIQPEVSGAHWSEFDRLGEFVDCGREAALEALPSLREQLDMRRRWIYRLQQWVRGVV